MSRLPDPLKVFRVSKCLADFPYDRCHRVVEADYGEGYGRMESYMPCPYFARLAFER